MRAAGALEKDPAVRCRDEMAAGFLRGFNVSTLAKWPLTRRLWVLGANRRVPGAYTYEIARVRFIDEVLLDEVAAGIDELILLGAGLDSRPYRLAERLRGVRTIEVDHPASQASKRARLQSLLGGEPAHVTYVAIDFTSEDLGTVLAEAGHDPSAKTLFLWSGVSMYLPGESVAEVLSWVGSHGQGSSIVFDAVWAELIEGSSGYYGADELRAATASVGEPLRWGIPEGRVEETLRGFGLQLERELGEEEMRSSYLRRSDGTLHDRPYGFGVLLHARAADSSSASPSRS